MKISYTCKFCGRPGSVEVEDDASVINQVSKWVAKLACNRCASFQSSKRQVIEKISRTCLFYQLCPESRMKAVEPTTREILEKLTKRLTQLLCEYHSKPFCWETALVDQLIATPGKWDDVVRMWSRTVRDMAVEKQAEML
jgi:hypothetical protein